MISGRGDRARHRMSATGPGEVDGHNPGFWLHTRGDLTITVHISTCRMQRLFRRSRGRATPTQATNVWTGPLSCHQVSSIVWQPNMRLCGACRPEVWLAQAVPSRNAKRKIDPRLAEIRSATTERFRSFEPKNTQRS